MTSSNHPSVLLTSELDQCGFDICHPFVPAWYNDLVASENLKLSPLPNHTNAYLIGNTKRLWPKFLAWLDHQRENHGGRIPQHPLDTYAKENIETIVERFVHRLGQDYCCTISDNAKCDIFWSDASCSSRLVSMQRVASASGFSYTDPSTKLSIHPTYGAWTSFRAVVVYSETKSKSIQTTVNPMKRPLQLTYLLSKKEETAAKLAMQKALCASADESQLCKQLHSGEGMLKENLYEHWIALRDCVEVGRVQYRFTQNQLMYHYTKEAIFLKQE